LQTGGAIHLHFVCIKEIGCVLLENHDRYYYYFFDYGPRKEEPTKGYGIVHSKEKEIL
jgi:hypothetical protein